MDAQHSKQKCGDGTKLAKICMVSQQSETKTVVVEVHRSEEPDDSVATSKSTFTSERLAADEVRDKIKPRWHAAVNKVRYLAMIICCCVITCQKVTKLILSSVVIGLCACACECVCV
jgi:hypothetical protein